MAPGRCEQDSVDRTATVLSGHNGLGAQRTNPAAVTASGAAAGFVGGSDAAPQSQRWARVKPAVSAADSLLNHTSALVRS